LKNALFISAFFLTATSLFAQKDMLELLPGSDKLYFNEKLGANVLIGNVHFIYQKNKMYCDSALYFKEKNKIKAYGHVQITKESGFNLFCDSLWYDLTEEKAKLWSKVRARDLEYKLECDSMDYDSRLGRANYNNGGKVTSIDGNEILTSKIGYFYPDTKDFFFKTKVTYSSPDTDLTTDTLNYSYRIRRLNFAGKTTITQDSTVIFCEDGWYNTEKEAGELRKNAKVTKGSQVITGDTLKFNGLEKTFIGRNHVVFLDTTEKFIFKGDHLFQNDLTRKMFITKNALAIKSQKEDTLYIHADTLFSEYDTLNQPSIIKGYWGVKIFSNKIQGKCDSVSYDKANDKMDMFIAPILWSKKGELKSDTITVYFKDSVLDYAYLHQNASAVFEIDSMRYYNQIAGKVMYAYFKNDEVVKADVKGNAQSIYYPEQTEQTDTAVVVKRTGMNRIYASDLIVYLDSGEVVGITYLNKPDGRFYPINRINKEEQYIQNFKWNPFLRPKKWEDLLSTELGQP
jgi:lipopolysaccharide export system protein LptA